MKLHILQNVAFENAGYIYQWAQTKNHSTTTSHVYRNEPVPHTDSYDLLVIMGGSMGANDDAQHPFLTAEKEHIEKAIFSGKKILGICLGSQIIASVLGASVKKNPYREIGWFPVTRVSNNSPSKLADAIPNNETVFHWHGDTFDIPFGAVHLARSECTENQAFSFNDSVLALQFHCEMTPDLLRGMTDICKDEIVESKYIQPVEKILNSTHIKESNRILDGLLNKLCDT